MTEAPDADQIDIENFFSTRFSYAPAQIKKIFLPTSNFRFLYRMCN